jgi:hypothetical protein
MPLVMTRLAEAIAQQKRGSELMLTVTLFISFKSPSLKVEPACQSDLTFVDCALKKVFDIPMRHDPIRPPNIEH